MAKKTYRPKADAENLSVDINIPDTQTGGRTLSVSSGAWPYETEDPQEQEVLDAHELVTDRPEPSSAKKGDS